MHHMYEVFLRATKEVAGTPSWFGSKERGDSIFESVFVKTKEGVGRMQRCSVFSSLWGL